MIFDTSALLKRVLDEDGSVAAWDLWDNADRVFVSALAIAEAAGALASARRDRRVDRRGHDLAGSELAAGWIRCHVVDVRRDLAEAAAALATLHGLRGADAIHLATARVVETPRTVFATWDRRLAAAARAEGLAVAPAVL